MYKSISEHYNQYYRYDLPENKTPWDVVNSLFERVERNDQEALEEALKILSSNTFGKIWRWLSGFGKASLENVDDIMQNIREEILKIVFRGFPEHVTKEKFYGFLMIVTDNCMKNYGKGLADRSKKEQYDTEDGALFDVLEAVGNEKRSVNPEDFFVSQDVKKEQEDVLRFYLEALCGTKEKPYKVLTYCYAVLIPQLFKKSCSSHFKRKVDVISSRNTKPPFSHYNEEKNCLEGEIARKSTILMNWALDAMKGQKVEQLDREFLELYGEEPLNKELFSWGKPYLINMEKTEHNMPVKYLVVTEEFGRNAIKNWPIRVAESLRDETGRLVQKDREFCKKSVGLVEDMICR